MLNAYFPLLIVAHKFFFNLNPKRNTEIWLAIYLKQMHAHAKVCEFYGCENGNFQVNNCIIFFLFYYIYTCQCLPFNKLLLSKCLHLPIKTCARVKNVA